MVVVISFCLRSTKHVEEVLNFKESEREKHRRTCMYLSDTQPGFPTENSKEQEIAKEVFTMMTRSRAAR